VSVELELVQKDSAAPTQYQSLCFVQENPEFFVFRMAKCSAARLMGQSPCDILLSGHVYPVTWVYNANLVRIYREMKKVNYVDEALKSATW
jgi:hypothetical protein